MLVVMLEDENASISDISKAVKGGEGHKAVVWRILQKLEKSKLVKKVRGKYSLTKEGETAAKNIVSSGGTIDDDKSIAQERSESGTISGTVKRKTSSSTSRSSGPISGTSHDERGHLCLSSCCSVPFRLC